MSHFVLRLCYPLYFGIVFSSADLPRTMLRFCVRLKKRVVFMPGSRWFKFSCLTFLSLQNVLHTVAMRSSRADHRIKYFVSSVVIMSEVAKFLISSLVLLHEGLFRRAISNIYYDSFDFFRTCVPALVYVVQNNVLFFALSHLDTTVFQVI